jgi:hypothetical protein
VLKGHVAQRRLSSIGDKGDSKVSRKGRYIVSVNIVLDVSPRSYSSKPRGSPPLWIPSRCSVLDCCTGSSRRPARGKMSMKIGSDLPFVVVIVLLNMERKGYVCKRQNALSLVVCWHVECNSTVSVVHHHRRHHLPPRAGYETFGHLELSTCSSEPI